MAMKKEVHRRQMNKGGLIGKAKKKLRQSTDFVKTQQFELLQIFGGFKTSTKVVVASMVFGVFLFFIFSITHSLTSISDKQKTLDELDRQIKAQQIANENLEEELKGNMDEIIEGLAREKLDMIYPDEEIFINKAG